MSGCAVKSQSSRVLVDGKPANRIRPGEPALPGRVDLNLEQVVQELRVAALVLLGLLQRPGSPTSPTVSSCGPTSRACKLV